MSSRKPYQIIFAGIGGQGVLLASEVTSMVAFHQEYDVKKSEVHGMSQRGGSVVSHVRFGDKVDSPLISKGQADILVALDPGEAGRYKPLMKAGGSVIDTSGVEVSDLPHPRTINTYILGRLAQLLPFPRESWEETIKTMVRPNTLEVNLQAFRMGFETGSAERTAE